MTESQHTEWKSSWRDDHLRGGCGIDRTFAACREAGTPAPQLRLSGNDLRLEFPYAPSYLRAVSPVRGDESVTEGDGKTSVKTSVKVRGRPRT